MKLTELFKKLAVVSGVPETEVVTLLSKIGNEPLTSIEVEDDIANKMGGLLYTEDAAMNNPKILSKAKSQILDAVDTEIDTQATRLGLTDEHKKRLKAADTSYKKIGILSDITAELTKDKNAATGQSEKKLIEQIDALNAEKIKLIEGHKTALDGVEKARKTDKMNWQLDEIYNGKDYSLPVDKAIAVLTAKQAVQMQMEKKGVVINLSDDGKPVIMTKEGTKYIDNNVDLSNPSDFITRTLLESKLLKTTPDKPSRVIQPPIDGKVRKIRTVSADFDKDLALMQEGNK